MGLVGVFAVMLRRGVRSRLCAGLRFGVSMLLLCMRRWFGPSLGVGGRCVLL
jgi:hypothetical protein